MFVRLAGLTAAYLTLNVGLNIANKYVLSSTVFPFPITLSFFHILTGFLTLVLFAVFGSQRLEHIRIIKKHGVLLLVVGATMALSIGLNNASLVSISMTLNQVIRCAQLVFVTDCMDALPLACMRAHVLVSHNALGSRCVPRVLSCAHAQPPAL